MGNCRFPCAVLNILLKRTELHNEMIMNILKHGFVHMTGGCEAEPEATGGAADGCSDQFSWPLHTLPPGSLCGSGLSRW